MLDFSEPIVPIATSLACILLGSFVWKKYSKSTPAKKDNGLEYPPSPAECHWLWKHAVALAGDGVSTHDITFFRWMQKLNSKVVSFQIPVLGRMVVVGDASMARHVLNSKAKNVKSGSLFPKSHTYSNIIPLIGKKSLIVMDGMGWAHQRKTFNPGFTPDYLRTIVSTFARKTDRFLEFLEKEDIAHNKSTHMVSRTIDLTSDIIAQAAFGEDWGLAWGADSTEENTGRQTLLTMRALIENIGKGVKEPIQKLNPILNRKISKLSELLNKDMERLVQRRIASMQKQKDAPKKDILSLTLSSYIEKNGETQFSISDEDMLCITSQLKTFYFAGHDTTAATIAWAYWLLLLNPESLERARAEVLENFGKDWVDAVARGDNHELIIPEEGTTYENLQKCEYLDAISRETLRLYPPASSTRYQADPDETYGNYKIGNCIVHVDFYAIQRDTDIWGEDANDFRPERLMGEEGRKKVNSFGFLPFSKGMRDCIGKYFALLEIRLVLATLITRYDGTTVDADKEVFAAKITNIPKNGCRVKLTRRSEEGTIA